MLDETRRLNNPTNVLVVDDDPDSRDELAAAITEDGHICYAAEDADTAFRKIMSRGSFGVVVTDVQMPGQNGIAMIRHLREGCEPGRMPETIVVTGYPEIAFARDAVRLSAVDFLTKPVSRSELLAAVNDAAIRWDRRMLDLDRARVDARLHRLSSEFMRLCADLHDGVEPTDRARRASGAVQPKIDAAAVKALIRARSKREQYFDAEFFADPTWDMLLDLSAATLEGKRVTVSSLCAASRVPHATALRRLDELMQAGIVVRHSDSEDRRRVFVELTPDAEQRMTRLLEDLLSTSLAA